MEGVSQFESALIHDGGCPYCSMAARALERVEDIGAIPWYDERAQLFLEAQFGATLFAMVSVGPRRTGVRGAGRRRGTELAGGNAGARGVARPRQLRDNRPHCRRGKRP